MEVTGKVLDVDSGDPLQGATVELWSGNILLSRGIADNNGYFKINSTSTPEFIKISSASYSAKSFSDFLSRSFYELAKNVKTIDPVFVTNKIKRSPAMLFGLLAVFLLLFKKRV